MLKRVDIMTDIETLGVNGDVTIIQLSAVAFDITTGEELNSFNEYVDISQRKGLPIDGSTLKWWLETDKELLTTIIQKGDKPIEKVLEEFNNWIDAFDCDAKDKYLWGNGILFDNKIIQDQMNKYGLKYPIFYRSDRDVRTILSLACEKAQCTDKEIKNMIKTGGTKHHAIDDVRFQIEMVCFCHKILMDKA